MPTAEEMLDQAARGGNRAFANDFRDNPPTYPETIEELKDAGLEGLSDASNLLPLPGAALAKGVGKLVGAGVKCVRKGAQAAKAANAARKAAQAAGKIAGKIPGSCFVAGTQVATPDGVRPIELLRVGDRVLTTDSHAEVTEIDRHAWRKVTLRMPNPD